MPDHPVEDPVEGRPILGGLWQEAEGDEGLPTPAAVLRSDHARPETALELACRGGLPRRKCWRPNSPGRKRRRNPSPAPATFNRRSASRTGLQPCYQVLCGLQGTGWHGLEPISRVVRRQDGGKRGSGAWASEGLPHLAATEPGLEPPRGPRPRPRQGGTCAPPNGHSEGHPQAARGLGPRPAGDYLAAPIDVIEQSHVAFVGGPTERP
jgi:hypothetical protein